MKRTSTPMAAATGTATSRPDKAEQIAERDQGEHQPDRMQADLLADQERLQHVALDELAGERTQPSDARIQVHSGQNCAVATRAGEQEVR